jgi:hypothetical protein
MCGGGGVAAGGWVLILVLGAGYWVLVLENGRVSSTK